MEEAAGENYAECLVVRTVNVAGRIPRAGTSGSRESRAASATRTDIRRPRILLPLPCFLFLFLHLSIIYHHIEVYFVDEIDGRDDLRKEKLGCVVNWDIIGKITF